MRKRLEGGKEKERKKVAEEEPISLKEVGGWGTKWRDFRERYKGAILVEDLKTKTKTETNVNDNAAVVVVDAGEGGGVGKKKKNQDDDAYEKGKREAAERLHVLNLLLSEVVLDLHRSEVEFASRKSGKKGRVKEVEEEVLERVQGAFAKGSKILYLLAQPPRGGQGKEVLPGYLP